MAARQARILREGKKMDIPTIDLVPADSVVLEARNVIPADIPFFESHQTKVDESTLSCESNNVKKVPRNSQREITLLKTKRIWVTTAFWLLMTER
ncbi:hypothetical protein [Flavobacterium sp. DSR2-3-3]|uniref:P-type ATPase n=1 Tax=Flavobacterium sp. DSR2-3-3 TaxID=2804632 RepID=UPI003CF61C9D